MVLSPSPWLPSLGMLPCRRLLSCWATRVDLIAFPPSPPSCCVRRHLGQVCLDALRCLPLTFLIAFLLLTRFLSPPSHDLPAILPSVPWL